MRKREFFSEDSYNDINFLFWQILKTWHREKQRVLGEFGITASQLEVLSAAYYLNKHSHKLKELEEEEVTQIAISKLINVDPMTTSTVLRNLEKKKIVKRNPSKIDTRARVVILTKVGENLLFRAADTVDVSTSEIFKKIDEDALKEQLQILLEILTELNN